MKWILILTLIILLPSQLSAGIYYVSVSGNDANSGLSVSAPWKSIFKLNRTHFAPGDSILFNRGDVWEGANAATIIPATSGDPEHPITWGAYGVGPNPVITFASRRNKSSEWTDEGGNIWSTGGVVLIGNELFRNPSFSRNTAGWFGQCTGVGTSCISYGRTTDADEVDSSPGGYRFVITDHGASAGSVQLYTASDAPLSLTEGSYYRLSFRAKSSLPFTIPVLLFESDNKDLTAGMFVGSFRVTENWGSCTFIFRADRTTNVAGFHMLLGGANGIPNGSIFCVDTFSLREIADRDFFGMHYSSNLIFNYASGSPITGKLVQSGILARQGEWCQSPRDRKIRLYSKGNPALVYKGDIIIVNGAPRSGFWVEGKNHHIFQDIDFFALPSAWNGHDFTDIILQRCNSSYTGGLPVLDGHDYTWNGGSFPARGGGAVGATGNIFRWIVRYNNFSQSYDANVTLENGTWRGWGNNKKADGIWIYSNIFGLAHYNIEFGWNGPGSSLSNLYIYNNTMYDAGSEWSAGQRPDEPVQIEDAHIKCWDSPSNGANINIMNNILYRAQSQLFYFSNWKQWVSILTMDNNLYYGDRTNFAKVSGLFYHNLAAWKSFSGKDMVSLYADPLFISFSQGNLALSEISPARSAGVAIDGVTYSSRTGLKLADPAGTKWHRFRPSIGAYSCLAP